MNKPQSRSSVRSQLIGSSLPRFLLQRLNEAKKRLTRWVRAGFSDGLGIGAGATVGQERFRFLKPMTLIESLEPHDVGWACMKASVDYNRLTDDDLAGQR